MDSKTTEIVEHYFTQLECTILLQNYDTKMTFKCYDSGNKKLDFLTKKYKLVQET